MVVVICLIVVCTAAVGVGCFLRWRYNHRGLRDHETATYTELSSRDDTTAIKLEVQPPEASPIHTTAAAAAEPAPVALQKTEPETS